MDVEGVTDFKALRAKFQHDSSLATKPVQPLQKLSPRLGTNGSNVPRPVPTSKADVLVPRPCSKPPCPASQPSAVAQRVKVGPTVPMECNEEHKGNVSVKRLSSPKSSSPKYPVSYSTEQQASTQAGPEDAPLLNSFQHALQMWKNTLSGNEKASTELPARRAMNLYVQPSPEQRELRASATSNGSKVPPVSSHPAPTRPAQGDGRAAGSSAATTLQPQSQKAAEEEDYLIPESTQLEDQHNYEKTLMYLNQSGDTTTLCVIEVPKVEPQEHKKQKSFLFGESSPGSAIIEDEKEGRRSLEGEKREAKKPGGNEYIILSGQSREDDRGGMKVLRMRQDVTSTPQRLAKDRAEPLYYGAPKPTEDRPTSSPNHYQLLLTTEDVYDDVEGLQDRVSHTSDASNPSASDSRSNYEETYEDVEVGSDSPAKEETEKQKRFRKLFKIEKLKLKNIRLKENLRLSSMSVPNLADVSQEDMVYDDVEMEQKDFRNIFTVKKSSAEKIKMEKEEKIFRETFLYDKEISVINTATAVCSITSKRRADLPLTAGEQLDVIDITEGSAVICRNSEGRCKFVESLWHKWSACNQVLRS
ncbi:hypothetical protein ASZ78_016016 [Callipepla squamata]|uniref:Helically-extended SH3 domain-containing protein n=1 Tax=Callipepla squamata TaxID=9009 RepID=A0A226NAF5_CALSU|nr:hypothetical protein ASZ78_016016 [Callipepla squamata]